MYFVNLSVNQITISMVRWLRRLCFNESSPLTFIDYDTMDLTANPEVTMEVWLKPTGYVPGNKSWI